MKMHGWPHRLSNVLLPFGSWLPTALKTHPRSDLEAGLISAILTLPQAIALAMLAGMPPEYGIYTSIISVIIASLWGSSWHTLSGPNTAICVLITYAIAPLASAGSAEYINYVLVLSLMAGAIQLTIASLKLGTILDFISGTVINAVILAVACIIIISASSGLFGITSASNHAFHDKAIHLWQNISHFDLQTMSIAGITIISGVLAKKIVPRYALIIAMLVGVIASYLLAQSIPAADNTLRYIDTLAISLLPLSNPNFGDQPFTLISTLFYSALSIAIIGLMQTIVISRSIAEKSQQPIDTNQEIIGQGLSNITVSFFSGFAGSGSFNRSAAHFAMGARTPLAAIYASVLLGLAVFFGDTLISQLSIPVISGMLILVALSMMDFKSLKQACLSWQEAIIFFSCFFLSLGFGLNSGILSGVLLSLIIYLWNASRPNVLIDEYVTRTEQPITTINIDGNLFFGSVHYVERILKNISQNTKGHIYLLRTNHMTYLDTAGACMLANEAQRQKTKGNEFYIFITRDNVTEAFHRAGMMHVLDKEHIIYKGRPHPMQDLLDPSTLSQPQNDAIKPENKIDFNIKDLISRLRSTRLIGPLSTEQLTGLLEACEIKTAVTNDILVRENESMESHLILVEGELEIQRTWTDKNGCGKSHTKIIRPKNIKGGFVFQSAATTNLRIRVLSDATYLLVNADTVDEILGWSQQFKNDLANNPELESRLRLARNASIFQQLPMDNLKRALSKMRPITVDVGDTIITQGEEGEDYYLIEEGEADVMRTDPFTDETACVAKLISGDGFGEEALLQSGFRNASVIMSTPGTLFALSKKDFNELIHSSIVEEISANDAQQQIEAQSIKLLDCRYDVEYEISRIPNAQLIALDRLRWDVHLVDPEQSYIVYCRSGKRSKAAAYLLRERNIKAVSLIGGIKDWPYEIDDNPVIIDRL